MRQIVEVLRLAFAQSRSQREIAQSLGLAQSTIHAYRRRFARSGLPWPLPPEVDEAALEAALFTRVDGPLVATRAVPDWASLSHSDSGHERRAVPMPSRRELPPSP